MKKLICVIAMLVALSSTVSASEPTPQPCVGPDGVIYPWYMCPRPLANEDTTTIQDADSQAGDYLASEAAMLLNSILALF